MSNLDTPITPAYLDELEKLYRAASPGPFTDSSGYGPFIYAQDAKGNFIVAEVRGWGHFTGQGEGGWGLNDGAAHAQQMANAAFFAAAGNAVLPLIAEVRRMTKERDANKERAEDARVHLDGMCVHARIERADYSYLRDQMNGIALSEGGPADDDA